MLRTLTQGGAAADHYQAKLRRLRADLEIAETAARSFYREPARGFRLMKMPLVQRAVLHAYSEGSSLAMLARGLGVVRRAVGIRASLPLQP